MSRTNYISLGCTPYGEDCAQVGSADYDANARRECNAYRNQILRMHGETPEGVRLRIKAFPHDFGTYHELCVVYDESLLSAEAWAINVEDDLPEYWDQAALAELATGRMQTEHGLV